MRAVPGWTCRVLVGIACLSALALNARAQMNANGQDVNNANPITVESAGLAAEADPGGAAPEPVIPPDSSDSPGNLFGSAKAFNESAKARGIEAHFTIKTEMSAALLPDGGSDPADGRALFQTSVGLDFEKLFGWKGAKAYASTQTFTGPNASVRIAQDCQGFSNIDAPDGTRLFELWFEQRLLDGKVRVKAGRMDANADFAYVENAGGFLNSSMGYSPTIQNFSTYPFARDGGAVFFSPYHFVYFSEGVFAGNPNGVMLMTEAGVRWTIQGGRAGRFAYGYWGQDQKFEDKDNRTRGGASGSYVVAEQSLWPQAPVGEQSRGVAGFFQFGTADPWSGEMDRHFGGGVQWQGPLRARPHDLAGFGATMVHLDALADEDEGPNVGYEHTIESFYVFQVRSWMGVTSDIQFIDHPYGSPSRSQLIVGTVRMTLSF